MGRGLRADVAAAWVGRQGKISAASQRWRRNVVKKGSQRRNGRWPPARAPFRRPSWAKKPCRRAPTIKNHRRDLTPKKLVKYPG